MGAEPAEGQAVTRPGGTPPPACVSGKQRYPDRDSARAAIRRVQSHPAVRHGRKAPRQAYRCELCGSWHTTSMSRSQYLMWPGRRPRHAI